MTAKTCVPTLSSLGWLTEAATMLDYAFADFMATNYSQSIEFHGALVSLPWVIQKCGSDMDALKELSKQQLEAHLGKIFDTAQVVSTVREHPTRPGTQQLNFYITVLKDGVAHNFERTIENISSKTLTLFTINNG